MIIGNLKVTNDKYVYGLYKADQSMEHDDVL